MNVNKVKNIALVILTILLVSVGGYALFLTSQYHEQSTALTAKDAQLQRANLDIGLAESKLVKGQQLEKDLRKQIRGMEDEFQRLVDEHRLRIKSKDETIVSLRQRIAGGTTTVVIRDGNDGGTDPGVPQPCTNGVCPAPSETILSYSWISPLKRFSLYDPNIWIQGDEVFESIQRLKIEGFIFEAKDGQLQTRKVQVKEVDKDGKEIPGSEIEVVQADFTYTNRSVENARAGLLDMVTVRPYASFDTALTPGLGLELLNLGRFLPWANLGIGPYLAADLSDPLSGSLQRSRIGVHLQYHLVPPILDTNVALGLGISSPFNDLSSPVLTGSIIFYFTPDLNPFSFWKNRPEVLGIKL